MNLYLETWIIATFVINLLILFIVKDIRSTQLKEKKKLRDVEGFLVKSVGISNYRISN